MRAKRILPQAVSTDKELIRDYRHSLSEKSIREIPWLTIAFALVNVFYSITDRYIRHMPQISYVRIVPTLLGLFVCYLYLKKKSTPEFLSNLREIWFLSGLSMVYAISYMTYTTVVYKSSIPALLIIIFGAAVTVPLPTRRLAFIYFTPFIVFVGAIIVSQADTHPLIEMAAVFSWSVVCLIMNEVRDRLSFSEFTLKRQLEATIHELKTTQAQLIQKEKMASLGEITAGIAHEIQNPLNFVNNFSEVSTELVGELREEEAKSEPDAKLIGELLADLTQNLQKIVHHGGRASRIVNGMLDHSRTGTGERYPTDVNALANQYLHLGYQGWVGKDQHFTCELVTDFDPNLGSVDLIPQDMGRVLLNLLNNAFYAVSQRPDGAGTEYKSTVWVSTKRAQRTVEIRVKDNGIGIPDAVKTKIFQPFFTTKPTGEGTGLGLSLSYDIVTKGHGGSLTVNSLQSQFTEFLISLPA